METAGNTVRETVPNPLAFAAAFNVAVSVIMSTHAIKAQSVQMQ
jgi:hypothetical protein